MNESFRVLIFAYLFPPDAGSGTFRTLHFANHLAEKGVDVTIITAEIKDFHSEALIDNSLLDSVNPKIKIVRVPVLRPLNYLSTLRNIVKGKKKEVAKQEKPDLDKEVVNASKSNRIDKNFCTFFKIKEIIKDLLCCPDQHAGWIPYAVLKGQKLIKQKRFNCIYATGGPWSSILAGVILKKVTGVPINLDFRDPWTSNPNFIQKTRPSKFLETKIEKFCISSSNNIIANTEELRLDFLTRFRSLRKDQVHTITNGFDEIKKNNTKTKSNYLNLVHTGELYLNRNPEQFLLAISTILEEKIIPADKLRITFVGGISVKTDHTIKLIEFLQDKGVLEIIPRVPYKKTLDYLSSADVLLLIQTNFPLQIPRKLYEYLSFSKPILAITEEYGATANLIKKNSFGKIVQNNSDLIKSEIAHIYYEWQINGLQDFQTRKLEMFNNKFLASKLENIMRESASYDFPRN